jgi:XTP/dITP diphosphohydrolase
MPNNSREKKLEAFGRLLDILDELRVKCPWDRKQTNESLRPNTIEETMELADAIMGEDTEKIRKELGDVLLHIVFYAKIGDEKGQFDIADVCDALCEKLIYRHPHVFGDEKADTAAQVLKNWELIKMSEKDGNKMVLSGVPRSLPSLIKAERVQEKAANVGFDWQKREDVWDKVKEELAELEAELRGNDEADREKEFGDLFFSLVNAARLYGVRPDNALERTNRKFIARFNYIEEKANEQGRHINELTLAEMDELWNEAKRLKLGE